MSAGREEAQPLNYRDQGDEEGRAKEAEEEGREGPGRGGKERGAILEAH